MRNARLTKVLGSSFCVCRRGGRKSDANGRAAADPVEGGELAVMQPYRPIGDG